MESNLINYQEKQELSNPENQDVLINSHSMSVKHNFSSNNHMSAAKLLKTKNLDKIVEERED